MRERPTTGSPVSGSSKSCRLRPVFAFAMARTGTKNACKINTILPAFLPNLVFEVRNPWRRGELNPCPKTTQVAASTCLVWCFVVETRGDHRQPPRVSNRLCLASRPTVESGSKPAVFRLTRHGQRAIPRSPFIRRPYEPGRQSRLGLQHRCWQLLNCSND